MPFNCTASLKYKSILTSILNLYILADNLTESGVLNINLDINCNRSFNLSILAYSYSNALPFIT